MQRYGRFGDPAYWEARYDPEATSVPNLAASAESTYDWYLDYCTKPSSPLRNILRAYAPPSTFPHVLDIGCGDSGLCREMSADGYGVVGSDIAASAGAAQPGVRFVHGSAEMLPFRSGGFDVAIEKGTIDAMLCSDGGGGKDAVLRLLAEASRVACDGWLVCISYADPGERVPLLLEGLVECHGVRAHRIPIRTRNAFNGRRFHYVYACRLGAPLPPAFTATEDDDGEAEALLQACVAHDEARVTELLRGGASATSTTANLELTSPCMLAAGVGAIGCLQALLDAAGAEHALQGADVLGQTALHHAAMGGQARSLAAASCTRHVTTT